MATLKSVLIGLVLAAFVTTSIMLFYTGGVTTYSLTDYNNTELLKIQNTFNKTSATSNEMASQLQNLSDNPNIVDKVNALFGSAYSSVKLVFSSVGSFNTIISASLSTTIFGSQEYTNMIRSMMYTLIIILIFVGIVLAIVMKWQT